MNNVLKIAANVFTRKNQYQIISEEKRILIDEIRDVSQSLENAYNRFEFENDNDLIEASIYEIESLKAKYRHLLNAVKTLDNKVSDDNLSQNIEE